MVKPVSSIALAFCLITFISSCTKKGATGATGPAGPAGPTSYANIGLVDGHVSVYDQYGSKLFNGLDGIQVTLGGVSTVVTDINGYFSFNNVTTGNYELKASGTGMASTILYNVQFIKDSLYTDIKLSAAPTFNLSSFNAYHNPGSLYDSLVVGVPTDTRARNYIVFVNKASPAGHTPGKYLLAYVRPLPTTGWTTTNVFKVPAADLNYAGIFYGDKVYYSVASYVVNDASVYEDHATGQNVYNAVGNMLVDSTTSP